MAQFPKSEVEIIALAHVILRGLRANPDIFPVDPQELQRFGEKLDEHDIIDQRWHDAQALAAQLGNQSKTNTAEIIDLMHDFIRFAETVAKDDAQLSIIGWGRRATPKPTEIPGQCRLLVVTTQGGDNVLLTWKNPAEGGKPLSFEIERRESPDEAWHTVGSAVETQKLLTGQPTGKKLEYRVFAKNKAGDGAYSNAAVMVL